MPMKPTTSLAAALLAAVPLALALAPAAAAQAPAEPTPEPPPATTWSWGLRAGVFDMVNALNAYDASFDRPMPRLGLQVEADWRLRWRFAASVDHGWVEGEQAFPTDPSIGTGIEEELTMTPLHLTAAWRFRPRQRWDLYAGGGPSLLRWNDESDFGSASGTDFGGSVVFGLRRQPPAARWRWGGELRWSTFPGALPEDGVSGFFDEDDPGGLSLTLLATRAF
jgi:hypothetical protein